MSVHAIQRAKERYGLDINIGVIKLFIKLIRDQDRRVVHLGDWNNDSILYGIRFATKPGYREPNIPDRLWVIAVYADNKVVTIIPRADISPYAEAMLESREAELKTLGLEPTHSPRTPSQGRRDGYNIYTSRRDRW